MSYKDAKKAVAELKRITKSDGLIYVSFDGLEEDDLKLPHIVLDDGSFEYTEGKRKGMIFKHYEDSEIRELFNTFEILMFKKDESGVRDIIVKI